MPSTSVAHLGTGLQGKNEAIHVASQYFISKPVSARPIEEQRAHSRTFIVTLENSTEAIIKLKVTEIDLSRVALAHSILGDIAPEVHSGKVRKAYFANSFLELHGTLRKHLETSADEELNICVEIAQLLTRCSLGRRSIVVVDRYVVPRLQKILEMEDFSDTSEARLRLEGLLNPDRVVELNSLPLALCHIDVNHRNILVDNDKHICGLIDREHANVLPLAMNAWCICFLSVMIAGGMHLPNDCTIPLAEAFWNAFINGLPPSQRSSAHKRAVLTAMQTGLAIIYITSVITVSDFLFGQWRTSPQCRNGSSDNCCLRAT
ncbi:hypothetical protein EDD85DRAFT_929310 [Armillaria nabsnona]|nr:hypothetical protein EDD85DRAFT_929310 [Armillaria nabsnona]